MAENRPGDRLEPLITTVIPTYRRPQLLRRALRSVLDQSFPDFQVIVIDNASGDDTRAVAAEFAAADPRVQYHCHPENIGEFRNFQYALRRVDTPYFTILADDDYLLPDFYRAALDGFHRFPAALFSVTDVIHLIRPGVIYDTALEKWSPGFYPAPDGLLKIFENGIFDWTGILFKSDIFNTVGYPDPATVRFHDLDYMYRLAARHPFVLSNQPGAVFDWTGSVARAPRGVDQTWPGVLRMVRNLTEDPLLSPQVREVAGRALRRRHLNTQFLREGLVYLAWDNPAEARRLAAFLRDPLAQPALALALRSAVAFYTALPFTRGLLRAFVKSRKNLQIKYRNRRRRYQHLLPYLR